MTADGGRGWGACSGGLALGRESRLQRVRAHPGACDLPGVSVNGVMAGRAGRLGSVVAAGVLAAGVLTGVAAVSASAVSSPASGASAVATPRVLPAATARAETAQSSVGREFWLTSPPAGSPEWTPNPGETLSYEIGWDVYIAASASGKVTVAIPGAKPAFTKTIDVTAGEVAKVELPDKTQVTFPTEGDNPTVSDFGVHITSTVDISAYMGFPMTFVRTGFLGLPVDALGTRYRVLSYEANDASTSEVTVVGTADNTKVTLTLLDGAKKTVTIDEGETFAYSPALETLDTPLDPCAASGGTCPVTEASDATGIVVTSDKPVGVFGGAGCANIPIDKGACNAIQQMLPPTSAWGTEFYSVRLGTRIKGDTYRVLADQDGTRVSLNGTVKATLDAGEYYEFVYPEAATVPGDESPPSRFWLASTATARTSILRVAGRMSLGISVVIRCSCSFRRISST